MNMLDSPVRNAIEQSLAVGQVLPTPSSKGSPFQILAMDSAGIKINKQIPRITWNALAEAVADVGNQGGSVPIGATHGIPKPATLESCLMDALGTKTSTASYAASILEAARVIEYVKIAGSRAMHVRLLSPFTEISHA